MIEVEFNITDYPLDWHLSPASWEAFVVGKLKEAGIPVEGKLTFNGIKSGTLTRFDDPADFGKCKYIWKPE